MIISAFLRGFVLLGIGGLAGCATTSGVIVNQNVQRADYRSVYIVVHGGSSADMDVNLQKEFLRHGFLVSVGADGTGGAGTQLVARYADDWNWDVAMYLRSLDVMVFDAKSNVLLASGSWKNSAFSWVSQLGESSSPGRG